MAEHYLDDSVTQPFWDNSVTPRLEIDPGDVVIFECPEGGNQVTPEWKSEDLAGWRDELGHALIGSVFVKGCLPGDTLQVEVLSLEHRGWGWSGHFKGFGLLQDDFDYYYLHHYRIEGETCYFGTGGVEVPFEPFCGCMGVAPAEPGRLNTTPPRANAGNIDLRDIQIGSTVWLPVLVEGALFACGDCHANQGQGELCGNGIEAPMRVTLRFDVRKDLAIRELQYHTPRPLTRASGEGFHVTTAHGPDLMENARNAARYMVEWLVKSKGLTASQAYCLCGDTVDLKIGEIVDRPNWIVTASIPLAIFKGAA